MYKRLIMIGVLVSLLLFVLPEEKTYACTLALSPMEIAEVIVAGRVIGWEYVGYDSAHYYSTIDMILGRSSRYRLQIEIEVDEVLKGSGDVPTHFLDPSLSIYDAEQFWTGWSGDCSVFTADPTGKYIVIGLNETPEGDYYNWVNKSARV